MKRGLLPIPRPAALRDDRRRRVFCLREIDAERLPNELRAGTVLRLAHAVNLLHHRGWKGDGHGFCRARHWYDGVVQSRTGSVKDRWAGCNRSIHVGALICGRRTGRYGPQRSISRCQRCDRVGRSARARAQAGPMAWKWAGVGFELPSAF